MKISCEKGRKTKMFREKTTTGEGAITDNQNMNQLLFKGKK